MNSNNIQWTSISQKDDSTPFFNFNALESEHIFNVSFRWENIWMARQLLYHVLYILYNTFKTDVYGIYNFSSSKKENFLDHTKKATFY